MASYAEIISGSLVTLNMTQGSGEQIIVDLITRAVERGFLAPEMHVDAVQAVLRREMSASTALADGVALPHGRLDTITRIISMIGIHPTGVEFGAPDGKPVQIFVLLLVPATVGCNHIHFLANISRRLLEGSIRRALLAATTTEQVLETLADDFTEGGLR